jgi:hypothetical protein
MLKFRGTLWGHNVFLKLYFNPLAIAGFFMLKFRGTRGCVIQNKRFLSCLNAAFLC